MVDTIVEVKVSRLDQIKAELFNSMAGEFEALQKQGLKGLALVQATVALSAKVDKAAKEKLDAELKAANARAEQQTKAVDAWKAHAEDVLGRAWGSIVAGYAKLDSIKRITYVVERNGDTGEPIKPVLLLGTPKSKGGKLNTGTRVGGGKSAPITVDGKVYDSAAAAKKALLPAKADASMNRAAIVSALVTAGHKVS